MTFNEPDASGLFFVLLIFLSKSLSKMSLIQQPAPLITNEPKVKRIRHWSKLALRLEFDKAPQ